MDTQINNMRAEPAPERLERLYYWLSYHRFYDLLLQTSISLP